MILSRVASVTPLLPQAAVVAASAVVAAAVEAVAASDVIPNPDHFSIEFVFAYNRA